MTANNAPQQGFKRYAANDIEAVIYGDKNSVSETPKATPQGEYKETPRRGILTTEDFAVNLPDATILACGVAAVGGLFAAGPDEVAVISYLAGLGVVRLFRSQWRQAEAEKREQEYYTRLKFPIFVLQTDERTAAFVAQLVKPLESRFKGIKVFYTRNVLVTAEHYRSMITASGNEVLVETDGQGERTTAHVHEIYYQDFRIGRTASVETAEEYALRIEGDIIKAVADYKAMVHKKMSPEQIKKYFLGQN